MPLLRWFAAITAPNAAIRPCAEPVAIAIPLHELGLSGLTAALMRDDEAGVANAAQSYGRVLRRGVRAAARRTEQELGPVDVWAIAAFTSVFAPFTQIDPKEFKRATEVSYLGYVYGTRAALDRMKPRDRGTIVQVGSALAYRGIPLQSAYCGAKHAIQGFHDSLRSELLHDKSNVHVTMVQMPAVNAPQFSWVLSRLPKHPQSVPPIYQPEVAAEAVVFAADHPRRREYWVGAPTMATLIANKLAPGVLDRYLASTAYQSQQTDLPYDSDQAANLWDPADGHQGHDYGTHGAFDNRSSTRSYQATLARHRGLLGTLTSAAAAALLITRRRRHGASRCP